MHNWCILRQLFSKNKPKAKQTHRSLKRKKKKKINNPKNARIHTMNKRSYEA